MVYEELCNFIIYNDIFCRYSTILDIMYNSITNIFIFGLLSKLFEL